MNRKKCERSVLQALEDELKRLQQQASLGHEVKVEWLPGQAEYCGGKKLAEKVNDNTIYIYSEEPEETIKLLRHGFVEWMLSQHTKPYMQLVNKLITLFEEQQYQRKERIAEALTRFLKPA